MCDSLLTEPGYTGWRRLSEWEPRFCSWPIKETTSFSCWDWLMLHSSVAGSGVTWLVGGLNVMFFVLSPAVGMIIPTDQHSFQKGWNHPAVHDGNSQQYLESQRGSNRLIIWMGTHCWWVSWLNNGSATVAGLPFAKDIHGNGNWPFAIGKHRFCNCWIIRYYMGLS